MNGTPSATSWNTAIMAKFTKFVAMKTTKTIAANPMPLASPGVTSPPSNWIAIAPTTGNVA